MNKTNQSNTTDVQSNHNLDTLCQEFNGGYFYGLEYVLEEFFQNSTEKPTVSVQPTTVDWFGLNS